MSQPQPWVGDNAEWNYYFESTSLEQPEWGQIKIIKTGNVLRSGILTDQLVVKKYHYTETEMGWSIYDSLTIDTTYTYLSSSGDSVMYEQNEAFRTLYDFSMNVGDSLLVHVSGNDPTNTNCNDSSFVTVTSTYLFNIQGIDYRVQTLWKNLGTGGGYFLGNYSLGSGHGINEKFGPLGNEWDDFLLPIQDLNCWNSPNIKYNLLCYKEDGFIYDINCNYFETLELVEVDDKFSKLFPNPFYDRVYLGEYNETIDIRIYDNYGRIINQFISFKNEILDLEFLNAGHYRIEIITNDGVKNTQKIIKL